MNCYSCQKEIQTSHKISFREDCPFCRVDLHVCRLCMFYDPKAYNECKESNAERVVDKEKANYCEYFQLTEEASSNSQLSEAELAKQKLAELFKK